MNICEECEGPCQVCESINPTREHLLARRAEILNFLGLTYKQWALLEINGALEWHELEYEKEMDHIDFLLGDEDVK